MWTVEKVVSRFMGSIQRAHLQRPGNHKACQTEDGKGHKSDRVGDTVKADRGYISSALGLQSVEHGIAHDLCFLYLQVIWVVLILFRPMLGVTMILLWVLSSGSRTTDKVYCRHRVFMRLPGRKPPVLPRRTAAWNDSLVSGVAGISSAR